MQSAMAAARRRRSCWNAVACSYLLPGMRRLWWWLALASILSLLSHHFFLSPSLALAAASSISEFEGFGDDFDDSDDEPFVVPPPPLHRRTGFETDRGPPAAADASEDTQYPSETSSSPSESPETPAPSAHPQPKRYEYWDEDEFEGLPEDVPPPAAPSPASASDPSAATSGRASQGVRRVAGPQNYYIEITCASFLVAFGVAYFLGKKKNEKIALAWAAHFACKDGIFDKNFSLLGIGAEADSHLLMKEGQNIFKFYASGRRFCKGLLATMDLQYRHDLITCLWYFISPRKDELTIDVIMNEENMDPITFALVRKKNVKTMLKDWKDLQTFVTVKQQQMIGLSDELVFFSESRDLANDLLTDSVLDQVFGEKAFEKFGNCFVSLHFTDQFPMGSEKKVLQFKFTLPPVNSMADMTRLIALVPYYIDLVGRYKLNTQLKAKADAARAKAAQEAFKEEQSVRQEALQRKKEERRKALESSDPRVAAEMLRKREEKDRMRHLKKAMPKIRMAKA